MTLSSVHSDGAPDLSVVIVNYNSAIYIEPLLHSMFADSFQIEGRPGTLEVFVIENASRSEDFARFESLASIHPAVTLVRNTENVGYALANNQGFHISRGRWHMVCNPDVLIQRGCLQNLIDTLESVPGAALVGPLATMDPGGQVLMPPNELPDPYSEALGAIARFEDPVARFAVRRRARYAHQYWTAEQPLRMPMLSGGCFLGRRSTIEENGLFDPGYPLYYEDTDLFRRYHERDLGLWHVPAAKIVHHFSRSAIPRMKAAMFRNRRGAERYFREWFGELGLRCFVDWSKRADAKGRDRECPDRLEIREPTASPPVIDIPDVPGAFVEVAGNPKFSLTVGIFPDRAGLYALPEEFWSQLANTEYWCRVVDPKSGSTLHAWRLSKCPAT